MQLIDVQRIGIDRQLFDQLLSHMGLGPCVGIEIREGQRAALFEERPQLADHHRIERRNRVQPRYLGAEFRPRLANMQISQGGVSNK